METTIQAVEQATKSRNARKTVLLSDFYGTTIKRVSLPLPAWEGRREIGTGIYFQSLHIGRTRAVICIDSIWEDRSTGGCVGERYRLAGADDLCMIERYCGVALRDAVANILGIEIESL